MAEIGKYERSLNLKEGWLCLDFANTVDWHASAHPKEKLNTYQDLVAWAERVGLLSSGEAEDLRHEAELHPAEAEAALQKAIAFREAIYRIFSAIAHGRSPEAADLDLLNATQAEALARARITRLAGSFVWRWESGKNLEQILWPVARSAAELLTSEDLQRVGECADPRCGWLFLDRSRNRTRRWCDMKDCGNRAKVRRYYEQRRAAGKPTTPGGSPGSDGGAPLLFGP